MSKTATPPAPSTISVANAAKSGTFPPEQAARMDAHALPTAGPVKVPKPANEWEIGSVVQLRSGGPGMTVLGDIGAKVYQCGWFNADGLPRREQFPGAALMAGGLATMQPVK